MLVELYVGLEQFIRDFVVLITKVTFDFFLPLSVQLVMDLDEKFRIGNETTSCIVLPSSYWV
jgi:hypothetical protein